MKKFIFIFIIFTLIFILLLTSGCFNQEKIEFNKTKKELIKFDEKYWAEAEKYRIKEEEYTKDLEKIDTSNISKISKQDWIDIKNIKKNQIKLYSDYIEKFKSLDIPSPLDEFYYKKIEQFDNFVKVYHIDLTLSELMIDYWDNWNDTVSDRTDDLMNEGKSYSNKGRELQLEAQKIQREVYRKYGLDDLIKKWQ